MAFVVLAVTSHGALAKETREFVNRIAPFLQMTPAALERKICTRLQRLNGLSLSTA
jgi:hypothetical protein